MALFESFTNEYPVSKTLRFELIPQGKTLEHMEKNGVIGADEQRAENYKRLKKLLDEYYKAYIEDALADAELEGLDEYLELYNIKDKTDEEKKRLKDTQEILRKQITVFLKSGKKYNVLFKKDVVEKELPAFLEKDEDIEVAESFKGFTTMCTGFWENRKNMFSDEEKSTAIAYRIIHDNLPKFIDNMKIFLRNGVKVLADYQEDAEQIAAKAGVERIEDIFSLDYFCKTLSQRGIDRYNSILGGFTKEGNIKVRGINEAINLYNQKHKDQRIGFLQPLYKQILSDRVSVSFIPEEFEDDTEVIDTIKALTKEFQIHLTDKENGSLAALKGIDNYNPAGIYIKNGASLAAFSNTCFGDWHKINAGFEEWYDDKKIGKQEKEQKYIEARKAYFKRRDSFSLAFIEEATGKNLSSIINESVVELEEELNTAKEAAADLFNNGYPKENNLLRDETTVALLKGVLDAMKKMETFIRIFEGSGDEPEKDDMFYSVLNKQEETLHLLDTVYNKTRNYVTQKPYSTEKIKLTFDTPTLLKGWALSKETDNKSVIFHKDNYYYLGIMTAEEKKAFEGVEESQEQDVYEKMEYLMTKDVKMSIPKCSTQKKEVKAHFQEEDTDYSLVKGFVHPFKITKKEFDLNNVTYDEKKKWQKDYLRNTNDVEGYKDAVDSWIAFCMRFLETYATTRNYDFSKVYPLSQYTSVNEFYNEVNKHLYKITFKNIAASYVDKLVEDEKLYLFKIYNKDFSPYSKGRPNLHTMYWKALFSDENMREPQYKLNGEAEVFYRKKSINSDESVVHKAKEPIANKNDLNEKKESIFEYDIIKDRRYTMDKFQFHVPITMNYTAPSNSRINSEMRRAIKGSKDMHIIGIDRGERHLLYVSIIDLKGNIVEQFSLNEIINEYQNQVHHVNYRTLLDKKEKERLAARQSWKTVENIKELKDGYMSQVVHIITQLMIKYNAIVVMEDLNGGFKRGRQKVEKQVYQKFEKALIDKLNYYVDKTASPDEVTGLYHALQLTEKFESFKKMGRQNGALFYVPAWNTSKMDPSTGFVNLLYVRYESVKKSRTFIDKFKKIYFVSDKNGEYFAFDLDYNDFTTKAEGSRTEWTIGSYGTRIITVKEDSGHWIDKEINLTDEYSKLFDKYDIPKTKDMKGDILAQDSADFFKELMRLIKYTLQIRNSETNGTVDYMISPVKNNDGKFFCTDDTADKIMPDNADANGAYNIARKGLWLVEQFKATPDDKLDKVKTAISNKEWLQFAQRNI